MVISATGRGSISSFLKLAVDVTWVIACALLGFICIVAALIVYTLVSGQPTFIEVEQAAHSGPGDLAAWAIVGAIQCIGVMMVCSWLRGFFDTLVKRDPFVPENARRLSLIGATLAGMEAAGMLAGAGIRLGFALLGPSTDADGAVLEIRLNGSVWFAVLTLLVLSQIFREGAAMREEQKMTI
jgi:hypothetical protein